MLLLDISPSSLDQLAVELALALLLRLQVDSGNGTATEELKKTEIVNSTEKEVDKQQRWFKRIQGLLWRLEA